jgi:hypothetical protein
LPLLTAFCSSVSLVRESIWHRLPPLPPPYPSCKTSPFPEQEQGLPEHRHFRCHHGTRPLPARGLPRHCRCHVRVRRQRKASPNVAVIAPRRQGLAPRGERVQMDDEQCPGTTIGVGPKSELCEPVVTRLTQN